MVRFRFAVFFCAVLFLWPSNSHAEEKTAYFGGGCFWCTEADFAKINGVTDVVSGYMGGHVKNPSYKQVSQGASGHYEIVKVVFNPGKTSFQKLLSAYWRMIDPTDGEGSFCDRGEHYSSVIFYNSDSQKRLSEGAVTALDRSGKFSRPVQTKLLKAEKFYPAEEYHQDFAAKNPIRYKFYRTRCGRDKFINNVWKGDSRLYQLEN